jgi:hypothetical protein
VALATSSPGRYGTHLCTAVLPRLIQVHHQFPRLAPRCEVLVSLMSMRPVACKGGCFTATQILIRWFKLQGSFLAVGRHDGTRAQSQLSISLLFLVFTFSESSRSLQVFSIFSQSFVLSRPSKRLSIPVLTMLFSSVPSGYRRWQWPHVNRIST